MVVEVDDASVVENGLDYVGFDLVEDVDFCHGGYCVLFFVPNDSEFSSIGILYKPPDHEHYKGDNYNE